MVNQRAMWPVLAIYKVVTGFIGETLSITWLQLWIWTKLLLSGRLWRECCLLSAYKGFQFPVYGWLRSFASLITEDARPKIVDTPLTLIFRIRQGVYHFLLCILRQPIPHLWASESNYRSDYPRSKTKKHWLAVDSHFQDGAGSGSHLILIIMAANTSDKDNDLQMSLFCD